MLPLILSSLIFVLGSAMILPQLARVLRWRSAAGVSLSGLLSGVLGYSAWMIYSLHAGETSAFFALVVPALLQLATTIAVLVYGGEREGMYVPVLLLGVLGGAFALGGWSLYSLVLVSTVVWAYAPAIWTACRASSVDGVSLVAWTLAASYGLVWIIMGVVHTDAAYLGSGVGNFALSAAVIGIVLRRRGSGASPQEGAAEPSVSIPLQRSAESSSSSRTEVPQAM